jgi:hypothetical protein
MGAFALKFDLSSFKLRKFVFPAHAGLRLTVILSGVEGHLNN